jgi:hypothetical protein
MNNLKINLKIALSDMCADDRTDKPRLGDTWSDANGLT